MRDAAGTSSQVKSWSGDGVLGGVGPRRRQSGRGIGGSEEDAVDDALVEGEVEAEVEAEVGVEDEVDRPQPSHADAVATIDASARTDARIYPRTKRPVSSTSTSGKISPVTSSAASSCRAWCSSLFI